MLQSAIHVTKRVVKLLSSGIHSLCESFSAAAVFFFEEVATQIKVLLSEIDTKVLLQQVKKSIKDLGNWARDNPYQAVSIVLFIIIIIAASVLVSPLFATAGFTAAGPAAGESSTEPYN